MATKAENSGIGVVRLELAQLRDQIAEIVNRFDAQAAQLQEVRDSVLRMETQGYQSQINEVRNEARSLRDKVLVIETTSKIFSAGVAAGVSILVGVITIACAWALHIPIR